MRFGYPKATSGDYRMGSEKGSLRRVISGGQTGVDIAALRAAKVAGLETGGYMPKGWVTEFGNRPEYANLYSMQEHPSWGYSPRTLSNVYDADATLILLPTGAKLTGGTALTSKACDQYRKPYYMTWLGDGDEEDSGLVEWCREYATVNVAGPRESKCAGIEWAAEEFLTRVFRKVLESA